MKITPLEIRQKTFEKAFRGLDKDEVQAFLLTLSQQWEKLSDENKELRMKLESATRDTQKMREVESSLYKTLKTAEDTSTSMVEQASKSAELKGREAQLKADELLNEARQKARAVIEDAYQQCDQVIGAMKGEMKHMEQERGRLEDYLDSLIRDLQNLATEALEKAEKVKTKPKGPSGSMLSRAAEVKPKQLETDRFYREMNATSTMALPEQTASSHQAQAIANDVFAEAPVQEVAYDQPGTNDPFRQPMPDPYTPGPDPTPDIDQPRPEIPNPVTPMPSVPAPEIEPIQPDIPAIPGPPDIEQPAPDFQPMPTQPEIQPPRTERQPAVAASVPASSGGGSFFDEIQ